MDAARILEITKNWSPEAKTRFMEAVEAAEQGDLRAWYCTRGRSCDGKPHDGYEYPHARSDQWPPPGTDWFVWALMGGRGCIAGESRIDLADGSTERVDVLAQRGRSIQVRTLYGAAWTDGAPFVKGVADLFRVTLSDGGSAIVTDQHRFLTPDGWLPLSALRAGSPIASGLPALGGQDFGDQRQLHANVRRSTGTPEGSRPDCPMCLGWRGQRLHRGVAVDRGVALRSTDAGGRIQLSSPGGALESGRAGSHACLQSHRHARSGCGWGEPFPAVGESLAAPLPSAPAPHSGHRSLERSLRTSFQTRIVDASVLAHTAGSLAGTLPLSDDPELLLPRVTSWVTVTSISFERRDIFYDLTVPSGAHYRADGVWSHNSGKTRSGAEYVRRLSEKVGRIALIAPTAPDAREVMVEGESGLIAVFANVGQEIKYEPSKRRITFPSGSRATIFSAEEPDRLRGPQHGAAWLDEPAHMPLIQDVWDMLLFGLRLGQRPHVVVTTTPKPIKWVKEIVKEPTTRLVRASTYSNIDNLAPIYRERVVSRYEGTRLGRQELEGEILEDVEGALWHADQIVYDDLVRDDELSRIVIAIDPAGSQGKKSDETGIVAAGVRGELGYVIDDRSGKYSPNGWAMESIRLYDRLRADAIVVERNFGGDMVAANLRSNGFKGRIIESNAARGKKLRAEPVVSLYEQGRVLHRPGGKLVKLEEEMLTWVPGEGPSPNRVDALVWALTELLKPAGVAVLARPTGKIRQNPNRRVTRPIRRLSA